MNHRPFDSLVDQLRPQGFRVRLTTATSRPIVLRLDTQGQGGELRVHPLLFAIHNALPLLERYALSHGNEGRHELRHLGAAVLRAVAGLSETPARSFLPVLGPEARRRLIDLDDALCALGIRLELNDNRRLLLALRHEPDGHGLALGIHFGLLEHPAAVCELQRYAKRHGSGRYPYLDRAMHQVFDEVSARTAVAPAPSVTVGAVAIDSAEPANGSEVDLLAIAQAIHRRWFGTLPDLRIRWGRDPGPGRQLRSIHFGTFRSRPEPQIRIHPRLGQAWVARCFLEHVLHHEYCHWRQHLDPIRGERPHSARFKAWEREFPRYAAAVAWQRRHLDHLLAPMPTGVLAAL